VILSRKNQILLAVSGLLLAFWFWQVRPDNRTRVIFCNVGQGDGAIVIKNNFQMLIDAGPQNSKMAECLGRYVPFWDKEIEVFVASHSDQDHIGGLAAIKRGYHLEKEITYQNIDAGDVIRYDGIDFVVLSNSELSLIGVLKTGSKKVLFMGDADVGMEYQIKEPVNILKVGHHGSETSTSEVFLDRIKPQIAVISVGRGNIYGHPKQAILDRLSARGIEIKRTDEEGDLIFDLSLDK